MKSYTIKNFINTRNKILKEGGWVLVGQVTTALINLVGIRIVTEFLPAEVLGEATLWLGISILLKNIFIMPFNNYQLRFYTEYLQNGNTLAFNSITLKILLTLLSVSSVLFFIMVSILAFFKVLKFEFLILAITILYFFIDSLRFFFINQNQAERKQNLSSLWIIFEAICIYSTIYFVLRKFPYAESYIASMSIGILMGVIFFKISKTKRVTNNYSSDLKYATIVSQAYKFALPFVPVAILSWIMNLSSRYFIGIIGNTYEVGIFVATFSIASRPFILLSSVTTTFFRPILFEAVTKSEKIKVKLIFKLWLLTNFLAGIFLIAALILGNKFISNLLLSSEYRSNIAILFVFIGLGYFMLSIYQVFENFLFAYKKTREILYSSIVGTIVFIISNLILVHYFSSSGAAISIFISFTIQLITIYLFFISKIYEFKR